MRPAVLMLLAVFFLTACPEPVPAPEPEPPTPATGDGLFAEGCPEAGSAFARVITVEDTLPGEAAVGTAGDLLLANDRAAFVITDAEEQSTYWYYGGALADAVTVDGCAPGEDKLDELGVVFAMPDIFQFEQSILRAFKADTVEVVNDGSNGQAAIVRARGSDAIHWLVEHTLIKAAASSGGRPFSGPFGATIILDYVLEPDSAVLQIDITVFNSGDAPFQIADATLLQFGETLDAFSFTSDRVDLAGLGLDAGLPWLLASDGAGAYALGMEGANLATVTFSGVQVGVDLNQLQDGFSLAVGESGTLTRYFAVGDGDGATAFEPLLERNPLPIRDQPAEAAVIEGTLVDPSGVPTPSTLLVQAQTGDSDWGTLYRATTDEQGAFRAVVPAFDPPWSFRLVAEGDGRDDAEPVDVTAGQSGVELALQSYGGLTYAITADGAPSPGKLVVVRDDGSRRTFWLSGEGSLGVPPGTWDWTVTRGYEFTPARGTVVIPDDGEASIDAVLSRTLDTTGWISVDTHVHSSDSPDSRMDQAVQLAHAAAHGLDIVVHTEHENIVDRSTVPAEAGLDAWVNSVIGEEVTSVAVEHMTMFPAEPDGSPRGGYVEWYGMNIEELFAAMRARSDGGVNLINHPSWLNDIGWDRVAGAPTTDPGLLGFASTDPLWSWDLDGMEVMNGHGNIFIDGNRRFDDWMSMVNTGKKMIAVGCSDDHGGDSVGFPRTYVRAPSDAPAELDIAALTTSFQVGQAVVSAGAFASISIDGAGPGEQVTDTDGTVDLSLQIQALPEIDVTHFVVFVNCDQVASVLAPTPDALIKYEGTVSVPVSGDSHVVVAAFGAEPLPVGLPQYNGARAPRVMTNPIYVDGDGDGVFGAPGGRECTYSLGVDQAR